MARFAAVWMLALCPILAGRAWAEPVTTIRNNGSPANRVDLVILGDGYTAGQLGQYALDAETVVQGFFASEAFSEYRNYFNVHRIDVTSAESGADKPNLGIFRNTALDATYTCSGIQRLICVNLTKVNTVLTASLPAGSRDIVLVIVNDPEYGGSGGAVGVASMHSDAVELVLHELGHSFGFLADEYGGPPPPNCVLVEPFEVNATMVTTRNQIKWNHWISGATPIPTSGPSIGVPGLYQGAKYCDAGMYRPTDQSKMRFLNRPFEQVNNEQLVKRIYNFVSPLDSSQPDGSTLSLWQGGTFPFSVTTPSPFTHGLDIGWTIDGGAPAGTGNNLVVNVGGLGLGDHTVEAVIDDTTSMVRSDPSLLLRENRTWNVTVVPMPTLEVNPNTGVGSSTVLSAQYVDLAGVPNLAHVFMRVSALPDGAASTCMVRYDRASGLLSLRDDAGNWLAGSPVPNFGTQQNSQCSVSLPGSWVSIVGNTLTVNVHFTFNGSYAGVKNVYLFATSVNGGSTGWQLRGAWDIPGGVSAISVLPGAGTGVTQAFVLEYSNSLDGGDLTSARVRFGATNVGPGTCTAWYNAVANTISLLDDAGVTWTQGLLGAGSLSNSQCTLNLATSSRTINAGNLTLTLNITFKSAFSGLKNIYMLAANSAGASTGWVWRGSWMVPVPAVSAVSVTPNSGTGATQSFTLEYTDTLGATDLSSARVRFGASNVGPGTCTAWYDATNSTIRLMDDGGGWGAPVALGAGTLANSQCTLNLGSSTATPSGNNLTLVLNITFSPGFTGPKNIYMLAASASGSSTGWVQRGIWTPTTSGPAILLATVAPNSGAGATQTFTMQFTDSLGATDLSSARIRFGASNVGPGTCTAWYDATNATIKLMDDVGVWGAPTTLGAGTLANSQCTLDLATSTATTLGNVLTLGLNITFAPSFTGLKNIYLLAASATGPNTGWVPGGTWTPHPVVGPAVVDAVSSTPNAGAGASQAFTLQYSDSLGASDLQSARVRFGATNDGPGTCTVWYDATNATIRLMDDAGVWGAPTSLGVGSLANSQCTLDLATSTATPTGNNLTLVLQLTFAGGFTGPKNIYMLAASATGPGTGWLTKGTWTASPGAVLLDAISVAPNAGSGAAQAFTLQYSDSFGATDLVSARVRFSATNVGPGTCTVWYDATTGTIKLMDDAGVWGVPTALGVGTLVNSQCTLNLATSSANVNGTNLTLALSLSFAAGFNGLKNIYMLAESASGPSTGWVQRGTFTVNAPVPTN
jgi:hypothetical protein